MNQALVLYDLYELACVLFIPRTTNISSCFLLLVHTIKQQIRNTLHQLPLHIKLICVQNSRHLNLTFINSVGVQEKHNYKKINDFIHSTFYLRCLEISIPKNVSVLNRHHGGTETGTWRSPIRNIKSKQYLYCNRMHSLLSCLFTYLTMAIMYGQTNRQKSDDHNCSTQLPNFKFLREKYNK